MHMQIRGRDLISTTCSGSAEGIGIGTATELSFFPFLLSPPPNSVSSYPGAAHLPPAPNAAQGLGGADALC